MATVALVITLVFWGWQIDLLPLGIVLGLLLGLPVLTPFRLSTEEKTASQLFNFLLLASFVFMGYLLIAGINGDYWFIFYLKWLPLMFFPLMAFQAFSHEGCLSSSAFFISRFC